MQPLQPHFCVLKKRVFGKKEDLSVFVHTIRISREIQYPPYVGYIDIYTSLLKHFIDRENMLQAP